MTSQPLLLEDEISLKEETGDLHRLSQNPEDMAASIELAAKDVHVCQLSALYIAEQSVLRVIAFQAWSTVGEQERRFDSHQTYESLNDEGSAYQRLLTFRLDQSQRLETLNNHLTIVKKLLEQFKNAELTRLVLFNDILASAIMAWIVITSAEELETAISLDQRAKSGESFTKAFEHDAFDLQLQKEEQHHVDQENQESNFDKVYADLLFEFHKLMRISVDAGIPLKRYTILQLVGVVRDRLPQLQDIEKDSIPSQQQLITSAGLPQETARSSGGKKEMKKRSMEISASPAAVKLTTVKTSSGTASGSMRNSDNTVLAWTSFDPLQSQLYSSNGVFYRFDTTHTGTGKRTTTLWRAIKQGKEDKVAKIEWGSNGTPDRAIIGRNTMSVTDLLRRDFSSNSTSFNGPDGFQYWWHRGEYNEILLEDQNRNILALFRPFFPCKKYNIGDVYGELCFISDAGAGKVLHPPLMDMVCLTAMLNRIMDPA